MTTVDTAPGTQLVLEGPKQARLIERTYPAPPPSHVRVRVAYVGLCGVDAGFFKGSNHYLTAGHKRYPFVLGHEWSGTIDAVGDTVSSYRPGDRVVGHNFVTCERCDACERGNLTSCATREEIGVLGHLYDGAAGSHFITPASTLSRLPDGLSLRAAVLVEPATTAHHAVRRTRVGNGDRVAVLGTGTTGLAAVQLAKEYGADVTAIGVCDAALDVADEVGADQAIRFDSLTDQRFDVVLECSGSVHAAAAIPELADDGARIGLVGIPATPVDGFPLSLLVTRNTEIHGVLSGLHEWPTTIALAARGALNLDALIHGVYAPSDVESAFDQLSDNERARPKVLVDFGEPIEEPQ